MFPVLVRIGDFTITSFGVFVALGFLAAAWWTARELRAAGRDGEVAWDLSAWAAVAGILGAKAYYLLLHFPQTAADPMAALTSRAGLVWYGGFLAGAAAVAWRIRRLRLPVLPLGDAVAPGLALGYAVGRVGCFGVGDDYGVPTDLPWAVAFPEGAPPSTAGNLRAFGADIPASVPDGEVLAVHPTQLYETGMSLLIFAALLAARPRLAATPGRALMLWLALAGVERFVVEIFRAKDDRFFGGLSLAQVISVGLVAAGVAGFVALGRRGAPGGAVATGTAGA